MPSGTPLLGFTDFTKQVPSVIMRGGAIDIVNEAAKRNYLLGRFLRGRSAEVLQGGAYIRFQVMFDEQSTFGEYRPGDASTFTIPQVLTEGRTDWRFVKDYMAWTDEEMDLKTPPGATKDQLFTVYTDHRKIIEQRMWTSMLNGMESLLFRSPHNEQAEMETSTGQKVYSIPAFINEDSTFADEPGGTLSYTYHPGGWTTIEGINPDTESGWRNQVERYSAEATEITSATKGLFAAFERMRLATKFVPPGVSGKDQYFNTDAGRRKFICCSRAGLAQYTNLCREGNDLFAKYPAADPFPGDPLYAGIELVYVAELDTAALYNLAGTYYAEGAAALGNPGTDWAVTDWTTGPRYYWINGDYLHPVFHTQRYFDVMDPINSREQQTTWTQMVRTYMNLICSSRRRQGIVGPGY